MVLGVVSTGTAPKKQLSSAACWSHLRKGQANGKSLCKAFKQTYQVQRITQERNDTQPSYSNMKVFSGLPGHRGGLPKAALPTQAPSYRRDTLSYPSGPAGRCPRAGSRKQLPLPLHSITQTMRLLSRTGTSPGLQSNMRMVGEGSLLQRHAGAGCLGPETTTQHPHHILSPSLLVPFKVSRLKGQVRWEGDTGCREDWGHPQPQSESPDSSPTFLLRSTLKS